MKYTNCMVIALLLSASKASALDAKAVSQAVTLDDSQITNGGKGETTTASVSQPAKKSKTNTGNGKDAQNPVAVPTAAPAAVQPTQPSGKTTPVPAAPASTSASTAATNVQPAKPTSKPLDPKQLEGKPLLSRLQRQTAINKVNKQKHTTIVRQIDEAGLLADSEVSDVVMDQEQFKMKLPPGGWKQLDQKEQLKRYKAAIQEGNAYEHEVTQEKVQLKLALTETKKEQTLLDAKHVEIAALAKQLFAILEQRNAQPGTPVTYDLGDLGKLDSQLQYIGNPTSSNPEVQKLLQQVQQSDQKQQAPIKITPAAPVTPVTTETVVQPPASTPTAPQKGVNQKSTPTVQDVTNAVAAESTGGKASETEVQKSQVPATAAVVQPVPKAEDNKVNTPKPVQDKKTVVGNKPTTEEVSATTSKVQDSTPQPPVPESNKPLVQQKTPPEDQGDQQITSVAKTGAKIDDKTEADSDTSDDETEDEADVETGAKNAVAAATKANTNVETKASVNKNASNTNTQDKSNPVPPVAQKATEENKVGTEAQNLQNEQKQKEDQEMLEKVHAAEKSSEQIAQEQDQKLLEQKQESSNPQAASENVDAAKQDKPNSESQPATQVDQSAKTQEGKQTETSVQKENKQTSNEANEIQKEA